ncbi:MAG TPA: c-type cytochrome [Gemmatimonadaceae bacterium]|jgi:thiosulfate dehydrogenase
MRANVSASGVALIVALAACTVERAPAPPATGSTAVAFDAAAWKPPTEADIPPDSLGAAIRRGLALIRFTPESLPRFVKSNMRCVSCHENDGTKPTAAPLMGSHARFPKYLARSGTIITLADRVNFCMTRSLAGEPLPVDSRDMDDILAYLAFISKDVPVGHHLVATDGLIPMKDTLVGDTLRGHTLFASTCAICHQADGSGHSPIPALWGAGSFTIAASMARQERAATFIFHNMPQTAPGSLTEQQAFDLAAYIDSHPRPDAPLKENDWPHGGAPRDVPYATKGHAAFLPPARLISRVTRH